jgi:dienelactone hydrolase
VYTVISMTEMLLFHSAHGLTPGVREFADRLRDLGHVVHLADLFDGRVFDDLHEGSMYRDELGIPELMARASAAADALPPGVVFAGFSMGAAPAQFLAQTRAGAAGALLMSGCLPSAMFETGWPAAVPLSVHGAEDDPWVDFHVARELVAEAVDGELWMYPGSGHLFADSGLPEFDPVHAEQLMTRVVAWLEAHSSPRAQA